jgi:hypothetical protein
MFVSVDPPALFCAKSDLEVGKNGIMLLSRLRNSHGVGTWESILHVLPFCFVLLLLALAFHTENNFTSWLIMWF